MLITSSTLHRLPAAIQAAGDFFVHLESVILPAPSAEEAVDLADRHGGHVGFALPAGFVYLTFSGLPARQPEKLLRTWRTWACRPPAGDELIFVFRHDGPPFAPVTSRLAHACRLSHCSFPRPRRVVIGSVLQSLPVAPLPGVLRRLAREAAAQAAA
jgi:hypothetical protein